MVETLEVKCGLKKSFDLRSNIRKTKLMSEWMPSLNALRALEAVARRSSYAGAAQELNVTPAAVKQLVLKLEDALGVALVERRGRGIALTDAAKAAAPDLALAMRHLTGAVHKMRSHQGRARLIVTVEASLATTWLVPRLEDFRAKHPGINVLIDSSQQIAELTQGDVDAAIRYGVAPRAGLKTIRLFDDQVFPACSPAQALNVSDGAGIEHLKSMPLIHWDMAQLPWANATRRWFDWDAWADQVGVSGLETSKGLRFSDYGLAVQAAISGQGVILASWPILQDPFDAGLLVQLFPESARSTGIGYDLVTTDQASKRPEVAAFSEWLIGVAAGA